MTNRDSLLPAEAPWAPGLAVLPALCSNYWWEALAPRPGTATPQRSSQRWLHPGVCWLEMWGKLFHKVSSSDSCLHCRDLSVGSGEAVEGRVAARCWHRVQALYGRHLNPWAWCMGPARRCVLGVCFIGSFKLPSPFSKQRWGENGPCCQLLDTANF